MNLVLVHPDSLEQCRELRGRWIYADDDLSIYDRVRSSFGSKLQLLMAPADFQAAVAGWRKEFVDWVDENLAPERGEQWILTPLYKNPFSNNLFLHLSWLCVIAGVLKDQSDDIIVITDSLGLSETLRGICSQRVGFRSIGFPRLVLGHWGRNVKAVGGTAKRVFELATRMLLARRILGEPYKQRVAKVDLLVGGYLHDDDISETGVFRDRYFPGLIDWYRQRGFLPAEYPSFFRIPFRRLPSIYRRIKSSATAFVVFEMFITFSDLFYALRRSLHQALSKAKPLTPLRGMDVNPLVQALGFRAALGGLVSVALTLAPRRLSKAGIRPKWLMAWYENQVPDKANVIGFTRIEPPCRVIAVRQYDWVPNLISLYSTSREVQAGVSPRENWVCGQAMLKGAVTYDTVGKYRVVPALRYSHLYQNDYYTEERKETSLSILLTASIKESLGILTCVIEALADLSKAFLEIRVKPHPDVGVERMQPIVESKWQEAKQFVWETGRLDKLLNRSRVVVSAGTSSAVEAVCLGVPVIVIGRLAGLDMNPLQGLDPRLWQIVYDGQQLEQALAVWTPQHPINLAERLEIGRRIRNSHFQRVNDETMKAFMPDREDAHAPA